jgi:hypothetical protein
VLVIPGWLLRGVLRRRWSLANLMLVPVAFGVAFVGFKVITGLDDLKGLAVLQTGPLILQLLAAIPGLPIVVFPVLVVVWAARGRWSRLAWLLGATVALSLIIPAIALWIDSHGMDPAEHYSWTGWYIILVMSGYVAALIMLAALLLTRIGRAIRIRSRRPAQAS